MTVEGDELAALRAAVDELRATVAAQTTRLERLDAFTESMFSRVERAVRAGVEGVVPAAAPTPEPSFTSDDRSRLERLEELVSRFDRRMADVASAEPDPTPLASRDRELLEAIAASLTALHESRLEGPQAENVAALDDDTRATLDRIERSLARLDALAERVDELATRAPAPPETVELASHDRDLLQAVAARVEAAAGSGEGAAAGLSDDDRERLDDTLQRLDALAQREPSTVVTADEVRLADGDRDLLNLIVSKLAGLDDRLQSAAPPSGGGGPLQDVESIRAQAIEDVANAIERAIGSDLSSKQVRRLQRSLSKAASNEAASGARPVRRPRSTPAGPQRQVVRLERDPVDPILDDRDADEADR